MSAIPSADAIISAHDRIRPYIHRTPVLTSDTLSKLAGATLYFKPENLQKVGAFKARGALNAVLSLSEAERRNGVVAPSSGNHAQGIAYACREVGIPAHIVMPHNAAKIKIDAVMEYGAKVTFCQPDPEDRQRVSDRIITETGATFIHSFNDYRVIAGQATAAKELIEDAGTDLDFLVCPVGGGGLLSGTALSAHYFSEKSFVIGGEPEGAADAALSFQKGVITPAPFLNTLVDGLLATIGDKTFEIVSRYATDIVTVTDHDIVQTMKLVWERMKLVVEPSGVVGLAAVLKYKGIFTGKKVGVILTGGNVDLQKLPF